MIGFSRKYLRQIISAFMAISFVAYGQASFCSDEPALPLGLGGNQEKKDEPQLPMGLSGGKNETKSDTPSLPAGLGDTKANKPDKTKTKKRGFRLPRGLSGFVESRVGARTDNDPYEKDMSIGETRLQLQMEKAWKGASFKITSDFIWDPVLNRDKIDLDGGEGWMDLREASVLLRPTDFMDVKFGRQILTWGTGDMLFLNDMFPKDWNSFFIGRDSEYLKAPSDAAKISLFCRFANLDIVYTPRFDSDRFIDGRRISYYAEGLGRIAGRDAIVEPIKPKDIFRDDEIAFRLYRNIRGWELAAYAYHGFWKSPAGQDAATGKATFPDLDVYGASIRGPLARGIGAFEIAWYDSNNDRKGNNPMVRNSEFRLLLSYEQEIAKDFTAGLQYYIEAMADYGQYQSTLPAGSNEKDRIRQLYTLRLTKLMKNQNLKLSMFGYFSPTDGDTYLRPKVNYKLNDHWTVEAGGNIFTERDEHTFFGQFEKDSNVYLSIRFGF